MENVERHLKIFTYSREENFHNITIKPSTEINKICNYLTCRLCQFIVIHIPENQFLYQTEDFLSFSRLSV